MTSHVSTHWITTSTHSELGSTARTIITALAESTVFTHPKPTLAELTTHLNGFDTSSALAKDGGKAETAARKAARDLLEDDLRELGRYIDETGQTLEQFLNSKFPLRKQNSPVDIQPAPSNLRLKHGKVSGSLEAVCEVCDHRVIYEWQTAIGQNPDEWVNQAPTTGARITVSGFAPGTWVNTRARIRVPAGVGDWSSVVRIMML